MCTYLTEKVSITGSGKGPGGWFTVTDASVYFDHPVHAPAEHTLLVVRAEEKLPVTAEIAGRPGRTARRLLNWNTTASGPDQVRRRARLRRSARCGRLDG